MLKIKLNLQNSPKKHTPKITSQHKRYMCVVVSNQRSHRSKLLKIQQVSKQESTETTNIKTKHKIVYTHQRFFSQHFRKRGEMKYIRYKIHTRTHI